MRTMEGNMFDFDFDSGVFVVLFYESEGNKLNTFLNYLCHSEIMKVIQHKYDYY